VVARITLTDGVAVFLVNSTSKKAFAGNLGDDHLIVTDSPTTSTLKTLGLTTLTTVGAASELGIKLNNKAARVAEIAMFLYRTVIFYFSKIDSSQINIFQTHI
jgi:hypothetical protein